MGNSYTDKDKFKEWLPARYLSELTDDTGGQSPDNDKINAALDWGASLMESKLRVRDDIPIPAVSSGGGVNETLRECVHDLALYRLYNRRGTMKQEVLDQFNVQMTWLNDVAMRRANVYIENAAEQEVTKTSEKPVTEGKNENKFTDFTF